MLDDGKAATVQQLRARDLRGLLEFARELDRAPDLEGLRSAAAQGLLTLIRAEVASYDEVDVRDRRSADVMEPVGAVSPALYRTWNRLAHRHPLVVHYLRSGDRCAKRMSDVITWRELRASEFYADFYRPLGLDKKLAVTLPASRWSVVGVSLMRSGRDFGERERGLLDTARETLLSSHRTALAREQLRGSFRALEYAADTASAGVILLTADDRIRFATPRARALLRERFEHGRRANRLPEEVMSWLRGERRRRTELLPGEPPGDLVNRKGTPLVIRLVDLPTERASALILSRSQPTPTADDLVGLGLTPREAAVIALVSRGLTNTQIANELFLSPQTVRKHLEHVYAKLDVTNRTAAAHVVHESLRAK
jgi:DNA-binding NarL/FixJ family response regulator